MSKTTNSTLDVLNIERKSHGTLLESTKTVTPTWVPDEEASECMVCDKSFSGSRKHHCRHCGFVVCNNCSLHRMTLPNHSGKVRTCNRCVITLTQSSSTVLSEIPITTPPALTLARVQQSAAVGGTNAPAITSASPSVVHPGMPLTVAQKERLTEKVRREIEMNAIVEGKANEYHEVSQIYQQLHKTHIDQQQQPAGTIIEPESYSGVGGDVPDWAHVLRPFISTPQNTRMGRLKVRVVSVDNISLENAILTNVSNISSVYNTDPSQSSYVENATVSSTVVVGTMFHTTNHVDIHINEPVSDKTSDSQSRSGGGRNVRYGKAIVAQECLLDVVSIQQSIKTQITVHKAHNITNPTSQNASPVVHDPIAIPLGSLTIPIKDITPNTKQLLTLPIKKQQSQAYTNLNIPSYLRPTTSSSSKPCTVTLEVEFVCSRFAYLWSLFDSTSNSSIYESNASHIPPLTLHSLLYYTLLVLHALSPLTTTIGVFPSLIRWEVPLLSLAIVALFIIQSIYPVSLILILGHIWVLRAIILGLVNNFNHTSSAGSGSGNGDSTKPSENGDVNNNNHKSSQQSNKQVDSPYTSGILRNISTLDTTNTNITPTTLYTLASLSPDTVNTTTHNSTRSTTTALPPGSAAASYVPDPITASDFQFSELVLEFLDQIIPLTSLGSLSSLYHQIYGFYTSFIVPFHYVTSWSSPFLSACVVLIVLGSLGCTLLLPSHYVWIYLGLTVLLYNSTPVRLVRTMVTTAIKV